MIILVIIIITIIVLIITTSLPKHQSHEANNHEDALKSNGMCTSLFFKLMIKFCISKCAHVVFLTIGIL